MSAHLLSQNNYLVCLRSLSIAKVALQEVWDQIFQMNRLDIKKLNKIYCVE